MHTLLLAICIIGTYSPDKAKQAGSVLDTHIGHIFPQVAQQFPANVAFETCKSVLLINGDMCKVGNWVLISRPSLDGSSQYVPCKVVEILRYMQQVEGVHSFLILLQLANVIGFVAPYQMPQLQLHNNYYLENLEVTYSI